jgi:DNA polymerase III delta prime subunit
MNDPWVEKYRPKDFNNIVLDDCNKLFFNEIMNAGTIPNMLFYGPPGTGKTTTIINLIRSYQEKNNEVNNGLMIHLNASDDRGIDTIRTQIYSFVHTKPFFKAGTKFVILDEIDSMTKNAQQALSYMLHNYIDVRFCLICNYISKIDDSLQTMFIKIKFNKLPKEMILDFLDSIVTSEKLQYTRDQLEYIQSIYESDIRSMVNFIQLNQDDPAIPIIHARVWEHLYEMIRSGENINVISTHIYSISSQYNMDIKNILKDFVYYIWMTYNPDTSLSSLDIAFHNVNVNPAHMIRYVILSLN